MKENPKKGQAVTVFAKNKLRVDNLLVVDNSPLGPPLKFAARILMERGILDPVYNDWIGKEVGNASPDMNDNQMVLGGGQVILLFVILVCMVTSSMAILCAENFYSRRANLQNALVTKTNEFLEGIRRRNILD